MQCNITAVVLTKDEERNIRRCLESLSWCDEVYVVDSGSADRTCEFAKELGARVVQHQLSPFFFAEQRNWALDNLDIKSDWVLFIDADEVVTPGFRTELVGATAQASPDVYGFQLCLRCMFLGRWIKHATNFPSWHDRVVRRGRKRFVIVDGCMEQFDAGGRVERITTPCVHYGFNNGVSAWLKRHDRYSSAQAEEIVRHSGDSAAGWACSWAGGKRERRRYIERLANRVLLLTPLMRFSYLFFVERGFLDGLPGFLYCVMMGVYQFLVYLKVKELECRRKGLPF